MLIRSIFAREKLHERSSASAVLINASAFYTNNKIMKNVDEKQIQSTKSKPEILPEIHVVIF